MATRSIFHSIRARLTNGGVVGSNYIRNAEPSPFSKPYSADAAIGGSPVEEPEEKDDLRSRIFRLRLPKRSATTVLEKWVGEGNQITVNELRDISRELRRTRRYKHALEVTEYLVQNEESNISDADYASRIDLISKVFGIDAAERYFEGLQLASKTPETYTSLLHAYAASKQTERAEALFKRIVESESLTFGAITYNEMMTLYMSVGEVEKVHEVIQVLKRKKVSPDIFTYNLWLSSCAATFSIDELRKILEEMRCDGGGSNEGWARYIDLTSIYIDSSRLTNAESSSPVESEKSISQREWVTYDFVMILHTGLGNKDMVDQIWKSLRNTNQKLSSRSYICVISSYLMLGHLREAGEVVDQWKESKTTEFDASACLRILSAFRDVGLEEKASDFQLLLVEKKCSLEDEVS
ncbi:Pentatricopeptide repeat-containing protein [Raphanus sativus]|uniref:Pentatricopeptide repeat-containing protein At5g09450, mitochondrial n=1 Tax=Raphanus sativus TaxID=3726 RepID=A0A6J0KSP4_RAPSA|nr:pentatricopeptide repeat-containing protein At5g09450, mitochondrial [Raphanus sativus]KAJ4911804.1 Pentatricopeptide repeat-containing protein [Raphanus sativus]